MQFKELVVFNHQVDISAINSINNFHMKKQTLSVKRDGEGEL